MRWRDQLISGALFVAAIALSVGRLPEVMPTPILAAADASGLAYPFLESEGTWRISRGYHDGEGRSPGDYERLSLDFSAERGPVEGEPAEGRTVVAPTSGRVNWVVHGGEAWRAGETSCLSIKVDGDDSHYVVVCHVRLDRVYHVGDRVTRGERIGVTGADDGSGLPRVQLTLYTAESERRAGLVSGRRAAPFVEPWALDGCGYPDDGTPSQYSGAVGLPGSCPSGIQSAASAPKSDSRPGPEPSPTPAIPTPVATASAP